MTHDQIRIAVAEACGWTRDSEGWSFDYPNAQFWRKGDDCVREANLPNYPTSRDAIQQAIAEVILPGDTLEDEARRVRFGDEYPGDQFFVIKYKDEFAAEALFAYQSAVREKVRSIYRAMDKLDSSSKEYKELDEKSKSLVEYADEIRAEAKKAAELGIQIPN